MTRTFDFLFSFFGLLILSPIILVLLIIGLFDTASPLFLQERIGVDQKPFNLLKFRSMHVNTQSVATHLASAASITPFGHFLRKSKLDELPQLYNVIRGDMSLVGPRPERRFYIDQIVVTNPEYRYLLKVKPGITGLAQVNGRNAISWQKKFELDVWYVKHCSFSLDFRILLKTIKNVFQSKGINQEGNATMELFKGLI